MRLTIAAIGKSRDGPEKQLYQYYRRQLPWKVELKELEAKKSLPVNRRIAEEGKLLLEATQPTSWKVLLDERGATLSSVEFAEQIKARQLRRDSHLAFILGGADGVSAEVRTAADAVWAFGRASWPHMLARAMLMEQLYRAHTLLIGHPYHRG